MLYPTRDARQTFSDPALLFLYRSALHFFYVLGQKYSGHVSFLGESADRLHVRSSFYENDASREASGSEAWRHTEKRGRTRNRLFSYCTRPVRPAPKS